MERCVNKSRPKMHCDGKCQLMKKIEEQERKEQGQVPEFKFANNTDALSSKSSFLSGYEVFATDLKLRYILSDMGAPIDHPSSVFHPPPVC